MNGKRDLFKRFRYELEKEKARAGKEKQGKAGNRGNARHTIRKKVSRNLRRSESRRSEREGENAAKSKGNQENARNN